MTYETNKTYGGAPAGASYQSNGKRVSDEGSLLSFVPC
jgi:hypothetical protein